VFVSVALFHKEMLLQWSQMGLEVNLTYQSLQGQYEAERREMAKEGFEKARSGTLSSCRVNSWDEFKVLQILHYFLPWRLAVSDRKGTT